MSESAKRRAERNRRRRERRAEAKRPLGQHEKNALIRAATNIVRQFGVSVDQALRLISRMTEQDIKLLATQNLITEVPLGARRPPEARPIGAPDLTAGGPSISREERRLGSQLGPLEDALMSPEFAAMSREERRKRLDEIRRESLGELPTAPDAPSALESARRVREPERDYFEEEFINLEETNPAAAARLAEIDRQRRRRPADLTGLLGSPTVNDVDRLLLRRALRGQEPGVSPEGGRLPSPSPGPGPLAAYILNYEWRLLADPTTDEATRQQILQEAQRRRERLGQALDTGTGGAQVSGMSAPEEPGDLSDDIRVYQFYSELSKRAREFDAQRGDIRAAMQRLLPDSEEYQRLLRQHIDVDLKQNQVLTAMLNIELNYPFFDKTHPMIAASEYGLTRRRDFPYPTLPPELLDIATPEAYTFGEQRLPRTPAEARVWEMTRSLAPGAATGGIRYRGRLRDLSEPPPGLFNLPPFGSFNATAPEEPTGPQVPLGLAEAIRNAGSLVGRSVAASRYNNLPKQEILVTPDDAPRLGILDQPTPEELARQHPGLRPILGLPSNLGPAFLSQPPAQDLGRRQITPIAPSFGELISTPSGTDLERQLGISPFLPASGIGALLRLIK